MTSIRKGKIKLMSDIYTFIAMNLFAGLLLRSLSF